MTERQREFFELMKELGIHQRPDRFAYYFKRFFAGYDFKGKRVLDIGGGIGRLSFYAAASGASDVICLEPETAGSTSGVITEFERIRQRGKFENCRISPKTFQEFAAENPPPFDVIVSNASINHLAEEAVVDLLTNPVSMATYQTLIRQFAELLVPGGRVIIADCCRNNLFGDLGLRNPFCTSIEWFKHQNPSTWRRLFEREGFTLLRKEFQTFNAFGDVGKVLLGNPFFAYVYGSLFILDFQKKVS